LRAVRARHQPQRDRERNARRPRRRRARAGRGARGIGEQVVPCHPERSEGSMGASWIPRFARDDTSFEGTIVRKELVSILSDLIALPSPYPPGTSVEICAYAAKRLKKAGYKVEVATRKKGVDNV